MPQHLLFKEDMREIVDSFIAETREAFEALDRDLLLLEKTPRDAALIDKIFRAVHTVKGTSGFLKLDQLSTLTHHFEDALNPLRRGELDMQAGTIDALLRAFDLMQELLQQVIEERIENLDIEPIIAELRSTGQVCEHSFPPDVDTNPFPLLNGFVAQEEIGVPSLAAGLDSMLAASISEEPNGSTHHHESGGVERTIMQTGNPSTATIRVEVKRLDELMALVGEMMLERNRLAKIVSQVLAVDRIESAHELLETTAHIDGIIAELHTAITRIRSTPIGRVFSKFPRIVRDLAKESNKQIDLVIEGEETELDRSLVEEISDPLLHLIHNAVDHGIELPGIRAAAGKTPTGRICLAVSQDASNAVIVIEDDGAGIDPERLKRVAIDKGLITPREAYAMNTSNAYALIFRPGFSTTQQVTRVSGRGVGMDVVQTNIARLNGTISIESVPGEGTKFTLRIPFRSPSPFDCLASSDGGNTPPPVIQPSR